MASSDENLYETRTNLLSSQNIIEYLWRRCEKTMYPFKPDNALDIVPKLVDRDFVKGKDLMNDYNIGTKDIKNGDIKGGHDYNIDIVQYETHRMDGTVTSDGKLALVYRPDRRFYMLFDMIDNGDDIPELRMIMRVKQKVSLFGSFETEMIYYY